VVCSVLISSVIACPHGSTKIFQCLFLKNCVLFRCHDIAEILLKLALNTNQSINILKQQFLVYHICGRYMYDGIISLRREVWGHVISLKCLLRVLILPLSTVLELFRQCGIFLFIFLLLHYHIISLCVIDFFTFK
jgi:hypothetical protein